MSRQICWIFSLYNEAGNPYLWQNLDLLGHRGQQLVVVDGGSTDTTISQLAQRGVTFLTVSHSTRGQRFDQGLAQTDARDVIFVHPRTLLTEAVILSAEQLPLNSDWGAFTHSFDSQHPILRFTSWWSNHIRGDRRGIFYLDHVLWARREALLKVGGFPHDAIFEDTLLCQRLLTSSLPLRLPETTVTSSLRFRKNGLVKQVLLNQIAKLQFYLRINTRNINQSYEQGLELNGRATNQGQQAPAAETPPSDDRT